MLRIPIVVGLDLSLRAAAAAVTRGPHDGRVGADVWARSAAFKQGGKDNGPRGVERLDYLHRSVFEFVAATLHELSDEIGAVATPDLFVVEGYGFDTHNAHSLGELGGIVKLELWRRGERIAIPTPASLKSFVLGKGVGDKDLMMKAAFKRWGWDVDCEGQTDAFCQSMFGQMLLSGRMTAAQAKLVHEKVELVESRHGGGTQGKAALPPPADPGALAGRVRRRRKA